MNIVQALEYLSRNGVALLRECMELDEYQLAALDLPLFQAKSYMRCAEAFFGAADSPRLQRETIEEATRRGHSVERLIMINRHATKLKARGAAWKLRAELVAMTGTYEEVNRAGQARVDELLGPSAAEAGVRISRPRGGMRTISITDEQRIITDFEKTLDAVSAEQDFDGVRSDTLRRSFWHHVSSGGGVLKPAYTTVIAIGMDDAMRVLRGEGDDVIVGLSDGTTMTGTELITAAFVGELGDNVMAGLFHPVQGPVNLYQARFASLKQRILAKAENLVCPWPGCAVPADRCQIHHMDAHAQGGETTPSNLTTLCKYHNGVNDDDPTGCQNERSRGRVDRHEGKVQYRSPSGTLIDNDHINSTLGAMSLI